MPADMSSRAHHFLERSLLFEHEPSGWGSRAVGPLNSRQERHLRSCGQISRVYATYNLVKVEMIDGCRYLFSWDSLVEHFPSYDWNSLQNVEYMRRWLGLRGNEWWVLEQQDPTPAEQDPTPAGLTAAELTVEVDVDAAEVDAAEVRTLAEPANLLARYREATAFSDGTGFSANLHNSLLAGRSGPRRRLPLIGQEVLAILRGLGYSIPTVPPSFESDLGIAIVAATRRQMTLIQEEQNNRASRIEELQSALEDARHARRRNGGNSATFARAVRGWREAGDAEAKVSAFERLMECVDSAPTPRNC